MMRQQFIITVCLGTLLVIAIVLKFMFYPVVRGHTAYYFYSTFWICGLLITVFSLNMIWMRWKPKKKVDHEPSSSFWPNRRETFRIIYPMFIRPVLILDRIDGSDRRPLEFSVVDLSQEGCCFADEGCLGGMQSFSGHIRFYDGDSIAVSGAFIRKTGTNFSVRFNSAIEWSTLFRQQS